MHKEAELRTSRKDEVKGKNKETAYVEKWKRKSEEQS